MKVILAIALAVTLLSAGACKQDNKTPNDATPKSTQTTATPREPMPTSSSQKSIIPTPGPGLSPVKP